jgi:predicted nucleic-acid-binding Zn-ribbon protein
MDPPEERKKQRDQALAWLNQHWGEPRICPFCGSNNWNIGDLVVAPLAGSQLEGWVSVFFPVTCLVCAYTRFFDAIVMGIVEGSIEPPP